MSEENRKAFEQAVSDLDNLEAGERALKNLGFDTSDIVPALKQARALVDTMKKLGK